MKKKVLALFLALTMVGAVLCGCKDGSGQGAEGSNGLNQERKANGEIVVAIAQDLEDSLDPHGSVSAGTREVLFNIYEGLVKTTPSGELIPAVAADYTISDDGRKEHQAGERGRWRNGLHLWMDAVGPGHPAKSEGYRWTAGSCDR